MEQEIYEKIKKEQKDYETLSQDDYSEIKKLEKEELVKRYLYLKKVKDEIDKMRFYDGKNPDIPALIIDNYGYGQIKKTNEIWTPILEFPKETFEDFFKKSLPDIPPKTMLTMYWDLENRKKEIYIPEFEKKEFESTHKVITGNMEIRDAEGRYYNTRYQFFKILLEEGQEEAVSYIIDKYGVNKGMSR